MSRVIFLHGTSSCGKSTLARQIQAMAPIPYWHVASDQLIEAQMLPDAQTCQCPFDWPTHRPKFFAAFHGFIKAILDAGNHIILDHIIESPQWYAELQLLLSDHEVLYVGLHCPIEELRQREQQRSDRDVGHRYSGEAEYHLRHVHSYSRYDLEIDTHRHSPMQAAQRVINANMPPRRSAFFNPAS